MILNVLLIQQWFPFREGSINGVTWFLSVSIFCYFCFPYILRRIENKYSRRKAFVAIGGLYLLQLVCGLIGKSLPTPQFSYEGLWYEDFTKWFVYNFPLTRIIDFVLGCNLGYLFITREGHDYLIEKKQNCISVLTIVAIVVANICYIVMTKKELLDSSLPLPRPERWWTYVLIYTLSSCALVYFVALEYTYIARFITNKWMIYLGNISQYAFLIHYVIFKYLDGVISRIIGDEFNFRYGPYIMMTLGFVLTLLLTQIWIRIISYRCKI